MIAHAMLLAQHAVELIFRVAPVLPALLVQAQILVALHQKGFEHLHFYSCGLMSESGMRTIAPCVVRLSSNRCASLA